MDVCAQKRGGGGDARTGQLSFKSWGEVTEPCVSEIFVEREVGVTLWGWGCGVGGGGNPTSVF